MDREQARVSACCVTEAGGVMDAHKPAATEQFRAAIERAGLAPPEQIAADGTLHRFATNGRASDDSGWYVLHLDGIAAGAFGDWRSGVSETWRADIGRSLTPDEERAHREHVARIRADREALEAERAQEAAERAAELWRASPPAPADHPYLLRKGVQPHGLRVGRGSLVIGGIECDGALMMPLRDAGGSLHSLEFITAGGEKRYLPGGRITGCYFAIGQPDGVLVIAEGFATAASVHAATGYAVACATSAGNLMPVARALREKFPQARIIIAADNDESGTGEREATEAARAVGGLVVMPAEAGTDWNDVLLAQGVEAVRSGIKSTASQQPAATTSAWPAPTPLPEGLPPVAAFDEALLPPILRQYVSDIAERMQCPPDFPAVALMIGLASIVGRRCGIQPKRLDDWTVVPNLWGMVIGRPGIMKSPALQEMMRPLQVLQARAVADHESDLAAWQAGSIVAAESQRVVKDAIRKLLKSGKQAEAADRAEEAVHAADEEPKCKRYVVTDATVEKLGEILNQNPAGVLHFRDELTGFFRTLDRQGHEADRAFYLECWNGDGSYTYDRIGRGTLHIPGACLSILGGIQPGPLTDLVRGLRGSGDDGLLQRFQLAVWPDVSHDWSNVDRHPDRDARERMQSLFERLDAITAERIGADPGAIPALRFSDDAQLLFDRWREQLERRLRGEGLHPAIEAHLSKYRSLAPSLALLCHLAEHHEGPVELLSLERAIAWTEYLETHAQRIYAPAISPDIDAARALGAHIRRGDVGTEFSLRDIYNKGWSGLATRDDAAAAVRVLEDFDWLRSEQEQTSGRPRTVYRLNPLLLSEARA